MAEGRMLKRVISESKKLGGLKSDSARLLYTWLIPWLDVEGRHSADPEIIKGHVFPKVKNMTSRKIDNLLYVLNDTKLINLYSANGENYLQFTKFHELQTIRKDREGESKIPAPTKDSSVTPGVIQENPCLIKDKLIEGNSIKDNIKEKEINSEFEEFWKFYRLIGNPKDDIGDKQEAKKAYNTLRRSISKKEIAKATHGEADYLKYKRLQENFTQRKKFASTWLRSNRWQTHKDFKYEATL